MFAILVQHYAGELRTPLTDVREVLGEVLRATLLLQQTAGAFNCPRSLISFFFPLLSDAYNNNIRRAAQLRRQPVVCNLVLRLHHVRMLL